MGVEVIVSKQGWTMEEGTFAGWLKQEGEQVAEGEPLFVIETDKATQEVEAIEAGILHIAPGAPEPNTTVTVGTLLGYILQEGEPPPPGAAPAAAEPEAATPATPPTPVPPSARQGHTPHGSSGTAAAEPAISPRARRIARELGVDIAALHGSGRTGRIVEADVRRAAAPGAVAGRPVPATRMRALIARRMAASTAATAPVTLTSEVDATELVALRQRAAPAPSYTVLLAKLTAFALGRHPELNAHWLGDRAVLFDQVDLGIAVDTEHGLTAPVLRDAAGRSLSELAEELQSLAEQARAGKLDPAQLEGATFTLTNLGNYGVDAFTPIINLPQCAILGIGRIVTKPAVHDGQVVAREHMALSLTFDHRAIDGGPAARFLGTIRELLEHPPVGELGL